jgi:hypothetical protein
MGRPEAHPFQAVGIELPQGALVEVTGRFRHEFVAQFLAEQKKPSLWLEEEIQIFPVALQQRGVDLTKTVFVETGEHHQWVLQQSLRSQVFRFVIAENFQLHEKEMRKLQLLAERSGATVINLAAEYRPSWVPLLSLQVDSMEPVRVQTLRKRGFA